MIDSIKTQFQVRKQEVLPLLLVLLGSYVIGGIILLLVGAGSTGKMQYFPLGTLIGVSFLVILHFFVGTFSFPQEFQMAVGMGQSRRNYTGAYLLVSAVEVLVTILFFFLGEKIELGILKAAYPAGSLMFDLSVVLSPAMIICEVLLLLMTELLIASLLLRFGMKAFWVLWLIWMVVCFGFARLASYEVVANFLYKIGNPILQWFEKAGVFGLILVALVVGLAEFFISWRFLRKQAVS